MTSSDRQPPDRHASRRIIAGLIIALVVWGAYLAVGASGVFTDAGLRDRRRSLIVLACSVTFVGFWLLMLRLQRRRLREQSPSRVSRSSMLSLLAAVVGVLLWALAGWAMAGGGTAAILLRSAAMLACGVAAVAALIGLSDPLPRRGKWASVLALLLLLVATWLVVR